MSSPSFQRYVEIPGSERQVPAEASLAGPSDPNARIEVSVYLRSRGEAESESGAAPGVSMPMTREQHAERYGANPSDIALVEDFAKHNGLDVVEASVPRRVVVLAGTCAAMCAAFQVDLQQYSLRGTTFRGRSGPIHVPEELAPAVEGVFGLDDRPQAARIGFAEAAGPILIRVEQATVTYSPTDVARAYNFPAGANGSGQTIALIELGGGYQQSDLDQYFQQLGLKSPVVRAVPVDGGANSPTGNPNSADGEVVLDIEVAGGVAPASQIVVYFAPNTDRGFLDAVTSAMHDTTNAPNVVSISWGGPEANWTAQAQQQMNRAFQDGSRLGVTVCCAAGDNGAADGLSDGLAHVDFPASSPFALACGGTRLEASGGTITSETVWNDGASSATGGGVSDTFPLPSWQANAGVPPSINPGARIGRGVPDVAGNADPQTGYRVLVDGQSFVVGGTSAVAPLWAGLIALINQQLGRSVGYLNPVLYQRISQNPAFHDITSGNNNGYAAGPGWDACTGLGTPNGSALLQALRAAYQAPARAAEVPPPESAVGASRSAADAGTSAKESIPASSGGMLAAIRRLFGAKP